MKLEGIRMIDEDGSSLAVDGSAPDPFDAMRQSVNRLLWRLSMDQIPPSQSGVWIDPRPVEQLVVIMERVMDRLDAIEAAQE